MDNILPIYFSVCYGSQLLLLSFILKVCNDHFPIVLC